MKPLDNRQKHAQGDAALNSSSARFSIPLIVLSLWVGGMGPARASSPGTNLIQSGATQAMSGGGTLGLNCNHLHVRGTFRLGPSTVRQANEVWITGTLNGDSGTLGVGGNWSNNGTFVAGSSTVNLTGECVPGPITVSGNSRFCSLNLGGTGIDYNFPAGYATSVDCSLNLGSGNTLISSTPHKTAYINLGPNATVSGNATLIHVVIVPYSPPPAPIPTLGQYWLLALASLLVALGALNTPHAPPSNRTPRHG